MLCPLDGAEAQAILAALDGAIDVDLGDEFLLAVRGRKTLLSFKVTDDGLAFVTIPLNTPVAAAA